MYLPAYFSKGWINLKRLFPAGLTDWRWLIRQPGPHQLPDMMDMLFTYGLPHYGHHHSGIDDATNIAAITATYLRTGGFVAVYDRQG
jgi:hypothetical protein